MDEPQNYYANWKRPDEKDHIVNDLIIRDV